MRKTTRGRAPGRALALLLLLVLVLGVAGCGDDAEEPAAGGSGSAESNGADDCQQRTTQALKEVEAADTFLSKGPNGEEAVGAEEVDLSEEEIQKVKDMKATAAIVLHYGGNDWSRAQEEGLRARFKELGIEVVSSTEAGFKPDKQVANIETAMQRKPDVMVSIPTDGEATSKAYKDVSAAGTKLVFMDNPAANMEHGKDYVGVVSADGYGNGVASAHQLARAVGCEGKVGAVFHAAAFFVTKTRWEAFQATLKEDYPDIEIVEEQGVAGPDFATQASRAANAMLTQHPDLKGIWAVWDVPAEGVIEAISSSGRDDVAVTTIDLGLNVAVNIADKDGAMAGLGAQRPYDQGVTEANMAAKALLGEETPPFVVLPALPIDEQNVVEGWNTVYKTDAPGPLQEAAQG